MTFLDHTSIDKLASCRGFPNAHRLLEKGSGQPVVIDATPIELAIRFAMADNTFAGLLPGIMAGLASGDADELVAGFFASTVAVTDPVGIANACQDLGVNYPSLTAPTSDTHPGLFADAMTNRYCEKVGPVPQLAAAPKVSTDIPLFVVLPSYESRTSVDTSHALFAGFTHATFETVAGVTTNPSKPCFYGVVTAFVDKPSAPVDATCLSSTEGRVFQ